MTVSEDINPQLERRFPLTGRQAVPLSEDDVEIGSRDGKS